MVVVGVIFLATNIFPWLARVGDVGIVLGAEAGRSGFVGEAGALGFAAPSAPIESGPGPLRGTLCRSPDVAPPDRVFFF